MPRLVDNLQGQLVLLVIAALAVAQTISLWLFVDERGLAVRAALGFEAAGRAANVALLLGEAPVSLHLAILRAANSPLSVLMFLRSPWWTTTAMPIELSKHVSAVS